jgi:hypothetical protein
MLYFCSPNPGGFLKQPCPSAMGQKQLSGDLEKKLGEL